MLKSLTISNFQVYENFVLEFDPLVTTIVGPTDAGKSTLLRALRWVCLNQPGGEEFMRHGTKEVEAILKVEEHTIARYKGKQNLYHLDDKDYKSFGQTVPEPIAQLLNVTSLSFQDQITLPFWFCLPAPQVGRELNSIVNLGVIDQVVAYVATELRQVKAEVEFTSQRLDEARAGRDRLQWVTDADQELLELEQLYSECEETRKTVSKITSALEDGEKLKEQQDRVVNAKLGALELIRTCEQYASLHEETSNLEQLITNAREHSHQWQSTSTKREALEQELQALLKICPLCQRPLIETSSLSS